MNIPYQNLINFRRFCIKNGVSEATEDKINRLNDKAHPKEFINDGDSDTAWLTNTNIYQQGGLQVIIDLQNGEYEVCLRDIIKNNRNNKNKKKNVSRTY